MTFAEAGHAETTISSDGRRRRFAALAVARTLVPSSEAADEHFPVAHTDAEWRKLLTPAQYAVLRQSGTEMPFSSPLDHEQRTGTFACAGCELALFSSTTKFDSRTGWPSFWQPLHNAVGTTDDRSLGMVRTAVHCAHAAAISAMSSTTARGRPACATA